jgi:hypothetical protein
VEWVNVVMQASFSTLLSLVSSAALQMSEPMVLLALGALLIALGFSGRLRSTRPEGLNRPRPAPGSLARQTGSVLAAQQTR